VIGCSHHLGMPLAIVAILTVTVAQLLDLATFMEMVRHVGPEAERNPFVASLFAAHGFVGVAIAKIGLLALVSAITAKLLQHPTSTRTAAVVLGFGIGAGLLGVLSNGPI
jgi:hypothetical protein